MNLKTLLFIALLLALVLALGLPARRAQAMSRPPAASGPPPGDLHGLAQFMGYGSYTAGVAEVTLNGNDVKVLRIVLATSCGHALNPDPIAAQVEGSVAYGLDSLLCESSVANGRIVQRNFDTYPVARLKQMPKVEIQSSLR